VPPEKPVSFTVAGPSKQSKAKQSKVVKKTGEGRGLYTRYQAQDIENHRCYARSDENKDTFKT